MENGARLIEITEEQLLAIKAMAYGCANNKRLVGASYMTGLSTEKSQRIPFGKALEIVQEFVDEQPAVDPESLRPKGRWEKHWCENDLIGHMYEVCPNCSSCEILDTDKFWDSNFCPNCGADMRGG